jgi:hypothetical protein
MAALAAAEEVSKGHGQHGGLLVAQATHIAAFGHLPMNGFPKTQQLFLWHLAGPVYFSLIFPERGR